MGKKIIIYFLLFIAVIISGRLYFLDKNNTEKVTPNQTTISNKLPSIGKQITVTYTNNQAHKMVSFDYQFKVKGNLVQWHKHNAIPTHIVFCNGMVYMCSTQLTSENKYVDVFEKQKNSYVLNWFEINNWVKIEKLEYHKNLKECVFEDEIPNFGLIKIKKS